MIAFSDAHFEDEADAWIEQEVQKLAQCSEVDLLQELAGILLPAIIEYSRCENWGCAEHLGDEDRCRDDCDCNYWNFLPNGCTVAREALDLIEPIRRAIAFKRGDDNDE